MASKFSKSIILMLFAAISHLAFSSTVHNLKQSEDEVLKEAYDVVQGEVIQVVIPSKLFFSKACFTYMYKLKVEKSFKQKYQRGDIVDIGINRYGQSIIKNSQQLIILMSPSKYSYQYCSFNDMDGLFNKTNTFSQHASKVGLFDIFVSSNGEIFFKTESCEKQDSLMYEEFFAELGYFVKKERRDKMDCISLMAPYIKLSDKIREAK